MSIEAGRPRHIGIIENTDEKLPKIETIRRPRMSVEDNEVADSGLEEKEDNPELTEKVKELKENIRLKSEEINGLISQIKERFAKDWSDDKTIEISKFKEHMNYFLKMCNKLTSYNDGVALLGSAYNEIVRALNGLQKRVEIMKEESSKTVSGDVMQRARFAASLNAGFEKIPNISNPQLWDTTFIQIRSSVEDLARKMIVQKSA